MLWYDSPHTAYCNVNTLRPRQNGHHFADDIFKCVLLNENVWITIKNSLKFVPKGLINNIPALVQIMAWCRPGDKPLSEPMLISLPTHICVTRPRWVNNNLPPHLYCWSLTDILKLLLVVWKYLNLVHVSNDVCSFISSLICSRDVIHYTACIWHRFLSSKLWYLTQLFWRYHSSLPRQGHVKSYQNYS